MAIHKAASTARNATVPAKTGKKPRAQIAEVANSTTPFEDALQSLTEATTAIQDWMNKNDPQDIQETRQIQEKLSAITRLLRFKPTSETQSRSDQSTSNNAALDELFFFRNGMKIVLLSVVESIQCKAPFNSNKTLAFFRMKGAVLPQLYAISGYKPCTKERRFVLDSDFWTEEVKKFAMYHNHTLISDGWDTLHGVDVGHGHASHAEKQAMVAAAYFLLEKHTSEKPSKGNLFRLKDKLREDSSLAREIEIGISDRPCNGCTQFKSLFEEYTGVTFTLILYKNLGVMEKEKNDKGQRRFSKIVSDMLEACEEPEVAQDLVQAMEALKKKSQVQVVIRSKPTAKMTPSKQTANPTNHALPKTPQFQRQAPVPSSPISPPKAPRKPLRASSPVMTLSRKRSYGQVDYDFVPQQNRKHIEDSFERERTPKPRGAHRPIQNYPQSLIDELDMEEARVFKRVRVTSISERWVNAASSR